MRDNECPDCQSADRVTKISGIMDSGTVRSESIARTRGTTLTHTFGHGFGVGGFGATTKTSSTDTSDLASSFVPVARPQLSSIWNSKSFAFAIIFIFPSVIFGRIFGRFGIILLLALFAYAIWRRVTKKRDIAIQQNLWDDGMANVRSGYYCSRDDVAFLPGFDTANPRMFAAQQFAPLWEHREQQPLKALPDFSKFTAKTGLATS